MQRRHMFLIVKWQHFSARFVADTNQSLYFLEAQYNLYPFRLFSLPIKLYLAFNVCHKVGAPPAPPAPQTNWHQLHDNRLLLQSRLWSWSLSLSRGLFVPATTASGIRSGRGFWRLFGLHLTRVHSRNKNETKLHKSAFCPTINATATAIAPTRWLALQLSTWLSNFDCLVAEVYQAK